MKSSRHQSYRIKQRRAYFARMCQSLPGFRWLRKGLGVVGVANCPHCKGPAFIDIGPCLPEVRCQVAGCHWLGGLNEFVQALVKPPQRRAA